MALPNLNKSVRLDALGRAVKKKADLILTKSVSHFGRNTLDMLKPLQVLHGLGVDAYFEQENITDVS